MHRIALLLAAATVPLVLWAALPVLSAGQQGRAARLGDKIDEKRRAIEQKKGRERVLSTTVTRYSRKIGALQSDITVLQRKQVRIQGDLDAKRAELARIQEELRQERVRLARLKARLAEARVALAGRLIELYKADKPDVVTVVLNADGFADLLDRTEFMQRVSDQDARIIDRVRTARAEATRTANRLDKLEKRQTKVAAAIEARRDEVANVRGQLVDRRDQFASVRRGKAKTLALTRDDRRELQGQLAALERENARVTAALRAAAQRSSAQPNVSAPKAGPMRPGSSGLIWPVSGTITSPFGPRWGRLHAGLDVGAAEGTPIRVAASGRVALAGPQGAYGLYTCVQHQGSLSTCYAHQSRIGVAVGQAVSRGQVIGAVGNTGRSSGAHLHFETRVNGAPVDPSGYL